jgi:hypothetical protein
MQGGVRVLPTLRNAGSVPERGGGDHQGGTGTDNKEGKEMTWPEGFQHPSLWEPLPSGKSKSLLCAAIIYGEYLDDWSAANKWMLSIEVREDV